MFSIIRHPILATRTYYRIAKELTPAEAAKYNAESTTEHERNEIKVQVLRRAFPDFI